MSREEDIILALEKEKQNFNRIIDEAICLIRKQGEQKEDERLQCNNGR